MKTDRELTELAAKAAGIVGEYCESKKCFSSYMQPGWNPLSDDGDALRLATALRISIIRDSPNVQAVAGQLGERKTKIQEDVLYQCKHAATRRAIVRAAAKIGQNGNDGAVYAEYMIGNAVLSDWVQWVQWVAVDKSGDVWGYSEKPFVNYIQTEWIIRSGHATLITDVAPPLNFKNCIWEIKK